MRRKSLLPPASTIHLHLQFLFAEAQARDIKDDTLASLSGHCVQSLRNWRRGRAIPSITAVSNLAECLGYKLELKKCE